jgi:hypothetical protein
MAAPSVEIPYFQSVCHNALDSYFAGCGFAPLEFKENRIGIAYSNEEIVVDFDYWPEDFPNYCLMIGLAFRQRNRYVRDSGVGLWYSMPNDKQELWRFKNEDELVGVFAHVRDDILPTFGEPLWNDPQLLRQLVTRFRSEQDAKEESGEVERQKRRAEAAFKSGHFNEVVRIYSELSSIDLSSTDRKRLAIAQKRSRN